MNLKQRRALKAFQDEQLPALREKMFAALGFEPELEVDWDSLMVEDWEHRVGDHFRDVYFVAATKGFEQVGQDEMGKEAMKEGISKIVMQNKSGNYYGDRWAKLEGGVLTLDHEPNSNVGDIQKRADGLQAELEDKL